MGNSDHGIHGAGEGGIWLAVVGGFGGLTVRPDGVGVGPHLPAGWRRLQYAFLLGGRRIEVDATPDGCRVTNRGPGEVSLTVAGSQVSLDQGESVERPVDADWREQGLDGVVFDEAAALTDGSPTDETVTLVGMLKDAGVSSAIVAAGELDRDALTAAGFDAVVDATFLRKSKPDPQGPLVATQHLLALPWNCAGIAADADAADAMRRAGLAVVGVGTDAPQGRFDSVSDLTPETLAGVLDEIDDPVNPYLERNIAIVQSEQKQKAGR
jgi:beta-phosphoglucomutase-like phosphatase (HAD superfamily)